MRLGPPIRPAIPPRCLSQRGRHPSLHCAPEHLRRALLYPPIPASEGESSGRAPRSVFLYIAEGSEIECIRPPVPPAATASRSLRPPPPQAAVGSLPTQNTAATIHGLPTTQKDVLTAGVAPSVSAAGHPPRPAPLQAPPPLRWLPAPASAATATSCGYPHHALAPPAAAGSRRLQPPPASATRKARRCNRAVPAVVGATLGLGREKKDATASRFPADLVRGSQYVPNLRAVRSPRAV